MMGMLPLIRMATQQGAAAQIQMHDLLELQSIMERLSAWADDQNAESVYDALGNRGTKSDIGDIGPFYLKSNQLIEFDSDKAIPLQESATEINLVEVQVCLTENGPSLSKVFGGE